MKSKAPKLATLTPAEDKAWVKAFCFYLQDHSVTEADRLTWRDLVKEFPRLRQYDGAKP